MELYAGHASVEELRAKLSKGRSKKGIFEGDLSDGELEVGQVASSIVQIQSVEAQFKRLILEYKEAFDQLKSEL
jgi:enoyl-[acyl-carrier protein] reductase II